MIRFCFLLALMMGVGVSFALEVKGVARGMVLESFSYLPDSLLKEYQERAARGDAEAAFRLSCHYLGKGEDYYREGYDWAVKAAAGGSAQGMMNAGVCYYEGIGVERDFQTAGRYFLSSYESGNTRVLNALSHMCASGEGMPRNPDKAFDYARQAVAAGLPHAQSNLAIMYADGIGVPKDMMKAKALLQEAIARRPDDGNNYYSLAVLSSRESEDYWPEIAPLLQQAADRGCSSAYLPLAQAYWKGRGVQMNQERAAVYMQKAVEAEDPDAYVYMAEMYYHGEGVSRDWQEAEKWYRKAIASHPEDAYSYCLLADVLLARASGVEHAEEIEGLMTKAAGLGNLSAMEYLVQEYAEEEGVLRQNMEAYAKWCCAAAEKNASWALLPAVALYLQGCAVDQDGAKAIRYAELAVQRNLHGAAGCLAAIYAEGKYVPQDIDKAVALYRQSIEQSPDFSPAYAPLAQCLLLRYPDKATLKEAFELLQEGARQGEAVSCQLLAQAYAEGWAFEGDTQLPPDETKAQEYKARAEAAKASNGFE